MDWDKTFDGIDILCDETNTYITLRQCDGKWYAEYNIFAKKPCEINARSLEEAKWFTSLNLLNSLNRQIEKLDGIRRSIPNMKKLRSAANKAKMERQRAAKV